jgi:hypothetical protein
MCLEDPSRYYEDVQARELRLGNKSYNLKETYKEFFSS